MTTFREQCSGAIAGGVYAPCKHGFPMTGPCYGFAGVPVCCNENLCARLYPETGTPPRHMRTPPQGQGEAK